MPGPVILHKECLYTVHKLPICTPPISLYTPPMSFSHRAGITTPLHCQTRTSPPSLARFHSHGEPHPFSLTRTSPPSLARFHSHGDVRRPVRFDGDGETLRFFFF
ncbi:hypothetical protein QL285_051234 [Trifolium repens]|nr:hypothetical protein QL285_051234 [Trifolium repens]